jgi:hypothetical protein
MIDEIQSAVTTSITILKKLREVSERMKDAEVKLLIADLSIELANVKQSLAELIQENTDLREQLRAAESVEGDPCPRCRKRTWTLASSKPSRHMGDMGVLDRTWTCSSCNFSETYTVTPGDGGTERGPLRGQRR